MTKNWSSNYAHASVTFRVFTMGRCFASIYLFIVPSHERVFGGGGRSWDDCGFCRLDTSLAFIEASKLKKIAIYIIFDSPGLRWQQINNNDRGWAVRLKLSSTFGSQLNPLLYINIHGRVNGTLFMPSLEACRFEQGLVVDHIHPNSLSEKIAHLEVNRESLPSR